MSGSGGEREELESAPSRPVRPLYRPAYLAEQRQAGLIVGDDGSRFLLWRVVPEDASRIRALFERLSEEEREGAARGLRLEPDELGDFLDTLAESGDTAGFVAEPEDDEEGGRLVGFSACRRLDEDRRTSTLTLAVDPEFRGRGIGTLLLERVAVLSAHQGVARLVGYLGSEPGERTRLFRDSGFEVKEEEDGFVVVLEGRSLKPEERTGVGSSRLLAAATLRRLFRPRSVAVAGASRDEGSVGRQVLEALLEGQFRGRVFPVNPAADEVAGIRCYPDLESLPEPADLVVVAVPAKIVPEVARQAGAQGAKGLVVVSAGFAETGDEGRERERELLRIVREHDMRMIGPNCLGIMNTDPEVRLNASFAPRLPEPGGVALCSQSGALGIAVIDLASRLGIGLSTFVSIGNNPDVGGVDLLEYWEEDPETDIVLFYLESFREARRFGRIARRAVREKPVIVVKSGRTEAGERAAGSHTAALGGAEKAADALFRQTGVIRATNLREMFSVARALDTQPLPRGRRVGVVTNSGGPAILCVDALEAAGLEIPELSEGVRARLREFLPPAASTVNPVDMVAGAGREEYRRAVRVVLEADEVDSLVVIYTPIEMHSVDAIREAVGEGMAAAREAVPEAADKPVFASIIGRDASAGSLDVGDLAVPTYTFPEDIAAVLGKLARYANWRRAEPGVFPVLEGERLEEAREICRAAIRERGDGWLKVEEAREALEAVGLDVAPGGVAADADEAVELAEKVGYPVVAKLASTEIVHKTEVGAVELDLADADAVRAAFERIRDAALEEAGPEAMQGVLVQPLLEGTAEVMLGADHDPVFGPVVAFGLGGIHVEILEDVAFRVAPLTDRDAREMVREIRGFPLLEGYRGHPAADIEALEESLLRLSDLVEACPEISEIDLNPVFALEPGEGCRIVDARIRVRDRQS